VSDGKESFGQKSERKGEAISKRTGKTVCGDAFHTLGRGSFTGAFDRTLCENMKGLSP